MVDVSNLPERLRRAGRTQAELARHLKLDPSSLTKTIKGERRLQAEEMLGIEEFFAGLAAGGLREEGRPFRRGARIPLYGHAAAGGRDRVAVNEGRISDWIDPPPFWSGAGELIGVRVIGESMEPRLFQGELVIAQLHLPPMRDQDCLVELHDGSALVKTYETRRGGVIICRQWNPKAEVRTPEAEVAAVHAIIWRR